jgi:cytoskeletal protein CcmA (bactofilin family)
VFNKRRNDVRDRPEASFNEASPEPGEPIIQAETDIIPTEPDQAQYANGNGGAAKPSVNNLKPSIISEGFEFIGEIRSSGYLTIDGTVRGTLSLHSIQIGVSGVLDGNVTCDTMNVKGNFSGALDCRDLTIGSRAVVDGKVSFKSITIQRGGVVKGELKKKP